MKDMNLNLKIEFNVGLLLTFVEYCTDWPQSFCHAEQHLWLPSNQMTFVISSALHPDTWLFQDQCVSKPV